jgi:hypothetical protein
MTKRAILKGLVLIVCAACVLVILTPSLRKKSTVPDPAPVKTEIIPPGIVVTESSISAPMATKPGAAAPGDLMLLNYANPASPPQDDLILMSRAIASFLLISKQAGDRPLSANEEWSAALRGNRPGTEPWISNKSVALDSRNRLIDRWGTPLHFHALGGKQWEIRSAGPDKKMWSDDDLLEKTSG